MTISHGFKISRDKTRPCNWFPLYAQHIDTREQVLLPYVNFGTHCRIILIPDNIDLNNGPWLLNLIAEQDWNDRNVSSLTFLELEIAKVIWQSESKH